MSAWFILELDLKACRHIGKLALNRFDTSWIFTTVVETEGDLIIVGFTHLGERCRLSVFIQRTLRSVGNLADEGEQGFSPRPWTWVKKGLAFEEIECWRNSGRCAPMRKTLEKVS